MYWGNVTIMMEIKVVDRISGPADTSVIKVLHNKRSNDDMAVAYAERA